MPPPHSFNEVAFGAVSDQLPDLRAVRRNRGLSLDEACAAISEQSGVEVGKSILWRPEKREAEPRSPRVQLAIANFYGFTVNQVWPLEESEAA